MSLCRSLRSTIALAAIMIIATPASAWPDKPIHIVNGFQPGGASDIFMRAVQPALSEKLGQPIILDYRTGAAGNLAIDEVARAKPDGYTLLMGFVGLATAPSLYKNLSFDPLKDLAPVSLIGSVPTVLIVPANLPVRSVRDLISLAKAQPGKLNYSSSGSGTMLHLTGALFRMSAKLDIVHIPYKGGAEAQTAVMSGDVQLMFNALPSALPMIRNGSVRALAVTGKTRSEALPNVPTMIESGFPDFVVLLWNGILAPAGTPRETITKLNEVLVGVMQTPEMKERLARIGQGAAWSTPEEFAAFLREETSRWGKVIQVADVKAQ